MDDIYQRLTPIFHEVFEDDAIVLTPELMASDVPDWDSLSHIRLILAVEKAFHITFSAARIANMKTVGDLAELIRDRTAAA